MVSETQFEQHTNSLSQIVSCDIVSDVDNSIEVRISRLERLIYLLIGLQIPDLLPYLALL